MRAEARIATELGALVANNERFGTIYADPPWAYNNQGTRASTLNHYYSKADDSEELRRSPGMTLEELCDLPIRQLSSANAHLHMWTTNAFLFECPRIFAAWDFEFRTSFVWVKRHFGIGNYWRNAHEIMLTAVRGNAKSFADKTLQSWIDCKPGRHSSKPERVRSFIERASPGPRLELFARSPAPGWTVWGNDVQLGLFDQNVTEIA